MCLNKNILEENLVEELKKDELTKLGNRHLLKEFLENSVDKNKKYFIVLFDLDGLHKINRKFGYLYGDKYILNAVNKIKKDLENENYSLFRIGGDEFLAIIENPKSISFPNAKSKFTIAIEKWNFDDDFYDVLERADSKIILQKKKRVPLIIRWLKNLLGCR